MEGGSPSGAYYLAGYSVECALKARIAKSTPESVFPARDKRPELYVHNLSRLLKSAGLDTELMDERRTNRRLDTNWRVLQGWSVFSRYEMYPAADAQSLISAIGDAGDGVLQWLSMRW